jgi:PelA/Pel-15E family pectate lyase
MKKLLLLGLCVLLFTNAFAQKELNTDDEERTNWAWLLKQSSAWYQSDEAARIGNNILLFQRSWGGWPKNINMARQLSDEEVLFVLSQKSKKDATIDNRSTYTHLSYLAKLCSATNDARYLEAFNKGFDYLMKAQYDNGGWPQFYPLKKGYYTHITYNDDAMTGVMNLLYDIVRLAPEFALMDNKRQELAASSFKKGLDCILKTQIIVNGEPTGWCAQHDEHTLLPAPARSFEPASISGMETVTLLRFLMKIEQPDEAIKGAVISACNWLDQARITGKRLIYIPDSTAAEGYDRILKEDPDGPDLWARFYSIENSEPLYVDRSGEVKKNYNDISFERRNNYAYIEQFAKVLLEEELPTWKKRQQIDE